MKNCTIESSSMRAHGDEVEFVVNYRYRADGLEGNVVLRSHLRMSGRWSLLTH